jgi:hypothetical protein
LATQFEIHRPANPTLLALVLKFTTREEVDIGIKSLPAVSVDTALGQFVLSILQL